MAGVRRPKRSQPNYVPGNLNCYSPLLHLLILPSAQILGTGAGRVRCVAPCAEEDLRHAGKVNAFGLQQEKSAIRCGGDRMNVEMRTLVILSSHHR